MEPTRRLDGPTILSRDRSRLHMGVRIGVTLLVTLALVVLAAAFVTVWLTEPSREFDEAWDGTSLADEWALGVALVLVLSTGPIAYMITRVKFVVAIPVVLVAIWGIGVLVADLT